ncbi:MAG: ribonuclease HII [Halobacteriaceae archaeon]
MTSRRFGVDEAGKGPVLGSLFVAAVVADPTELPNSVADSKVLTNGKRKEIATSLRNNENITIGVVEITPIEIDSSPDDMNTIIVKAHAKALEKVVDAGLAGTVDASDVNPDRFKARLQEMVPFDISITATHRADETDDLVGAASIIAKQHREEHIATLSDEYGNIGSGYPSDSQTREFLYSYIETNNELPRCARSSWQTCQDILQDINQSELEDY